MNGHRVSKDELLDPILDDDTIDYTRDNIPWEQPTTDSTEKKFQFAEDADPTEVQGIKNLLALYDAQLQATLNTHPAVLDPMVLRVEGTAQPSTGTLHVGAETIGNLSTSR